MYKALFYHKQDIFVWGILGLYHIRLIVSDCLFSPPLLFVHFLLKLECCFEQ